MMKKLLSAVLLLIMLAALLVSCGGSKETTPKKTTPPVTTPEPTTPDPVESMWQSIKTDLEAADASLRNFKFQLTDFSEGAYQMKCEEYMQGPDTLQHARTEIDQLVFERNDAAKQALGIGTITYVYTTEAWNQQAKVIKAQTDDASNPNAADMFVYTMHDMVTSCFNSSFRDLASIEGSYFDWEADGWHSSIMSDMSFDREKIYVMASDYFNELWRNMMLLPFNMTMVDGAVDELGPILLPAGETLKQGETLSDYLFALVQEGKWTWDVLAQMCDAIYLDQGIIGEEDAADRMGIYLDQYMGGMAASALYSTAIECLTDGVGKEGTALEGKLVPTYPSTGEAINEVFIAIGSLLNGDGAWSFSSANGIDSTTWFGQGLGMTPGMLRLGELEHEDLQAMNDTFSVVPVPLLEEGTVDDYNTYVHNTAALGAFNINSPKFLAMSAYIQYVSENSDAVKDEYLQIVMKFKTTSFNLGTSDMLDLIYSNIDSVREMILDSILRSRKSGTTLQEVGDVRWHMLLCKDFYTLPCSVANGGGGFLDRYESFCSAKQTAMDELMVEWYNLPTAPSATPAE